MLSRLIAHPQTQRFAHAPGWANMSPLTVSSDKEARMDLTYAALKQRQRAIRDGFPPSLSLRVHRALSWLDRAERADEDQDARFVFLWIDFNAAYANELHDRTLLSEKGLFNQFIQRLVDLDRQQRLHDTVWLEFPHSIRALIDNRYVFQPFWDHHNSDDQHDWEQAFADSKAAALRALGKRDTAKVISILISRLYTMRNQLIHGGATWNSQVNRNQVRDGANLMGKLVPVMISVMMDNPNQLWGDACYPVVD